MIDGKSSTKYSTGLVYKKLTGDLETVPWTTAVWIKGGVLKHNFFAWLVTLNRCPTRDRLRSLGLQTDSNCLLCGDYEESRSHIYFDCNYSWEIWSSFANRFDLLPMRNWNDSLLQMQSLGGERIRKCLLLLSWQAVIYLIWTKRNSWLHRNCSRFPARLITFIERQLKEKINSYREGNPALSSSLLQSWFLACDRNNWSAKWSASTSSTSVSIWPFHWALLFSLEYFLLGFTANPYWTLSKN